jgi:hypothetical protein
MDGIIKTLSKLVKWFFKDTGLFAQLFNKKRLLAVFCRKQLPKPVEPGLTALAEPTTIAPPFLAQCQAALL